jgi:hypothetical protein
MNAALRVDLLAYIKHFEATLTGLYRWVEKHPSMPDEDRKHIMQEMKNAICNWDGQDRRRQRSKRTIELMQELAPTEDVVEKVRFFADLLPDETNWLTIKTHLVRELSPADRQLFNKRDEKTKKHAPLNTYERMIQSLWFDLTGNRLLIPIEKRLPDFPASDYE